MIKTLKDNILSRLQTKLVGFSQASFSYSVEENKFKHSKKTYAVNVGQASTVSGVSCVNTMDHSFTVILTDTFTNGSENQLNDLLKAEKVVELQDLALLVFDDLQEKRSLLGSGILVVNNLSINAPTFLEEEKICVSEMTFNIRYKF